MNKFVIGLIGCGVVVGIGVVAYTLYKKEQYSIENNEKNTSFEPVNNSAENDLYEIEVEKTIHKKQSSVDEISQRHREASEVIRTSVENIFSEENKQGHHEKELDDISEGLDDILKEINE